MHTVRFLIFNRYLHVVGISAAKLDLFCWVELNFGPDLLVQQGRIGPQDMKMGPIGLASNSAIDSESIEPLFVSSRHFVRPCRLQVQGDLHFVCPVKAENM